MESAIFFGIGVLVGAALVLATLVFQRWYESYSFHQGVGVPMHGANPVQEDYIVDMPDLPTEEYFRQAQNYTFDGGHEHGEPDMSDEALERYARMAGIDVEGSNEPY